MDPLLAELIVVRFTEFVTETSETGELPSTDVVIRNASEGLPLFAHQRLPLPRRAILDAFSTLLASESDPERMEWLRVGVRFASDHSAGYGECDVALSQALAGLANDLTRLIPSCGDSHKPKLRRAISEYCARSGRR